MRLQLLAGLARRPAGSPAAAGRDVEADVCIVGAGYTGLWTAWALAGAEPSRRIVVVEAEHAGFGASGRNGGWLSGLMPGDPAAAGPTVGGRDGAGRRWSPFTAAHRRRRRGDHGLRR